SRTVRPASGVIRREYIPSGGPPGEAPLRLLRHPLLIARRRLDDNGGRTARRDEPSRSPRRRCGMTQHGPGAEAPQPERARMLEYLRARGAALAPAEIHARFRAAVREFEAALDGVRSANGELDALLGAAKIADGTPPTPTIRTILVAQGTSPTGQAASEAFAAELGWKEYALVQRLHLLDHRNQVRALRGALRLV